MLSKVKSMSLNGLDGYLVEIQTDISNGLPEFEIVGLPDTSVKEAKKRIESAIRNSNIEIHIRDDNPHPHSIIVSNETSQTIQLILRSITNGKNI